MRVCGLGFYVDIYDLTLKGSIEYSRAVNVGILL